jgi:hypothetical protein
MPSWFGGKRDLLTQAIAAIPRPTGAASFYMTSGMACLGSQRLADEVHGASFDVAQIICVRGILGR